MELSRIITFCSLFLEVTLGTDAIELCFIPSLDIFRVEVYTPRLFLFKLFSGLEKVLRVFPATELFKHDHLVAAVLW